VKTIETPVVCSCQSDDLIGIVHQPESPLKVGVLIVVGGPQYRVGSHRQFVLMARMLADNHIAVMRFDYRGMGDSEGVVRSFSDVDEDIKSALDVFYKHTPGLRGVVIWGLCDAASASAFYAYQDKRVKGLVLLNPWVFTEQGAAKTYLKHYYLQRLCSPALWCKVFSFQFDYQKSFSSIALMLKKIVLPSIENASLMRQGVIDLVDPNLSLPDRVRDCLLRFKSPILFILSGRDLTADEFRGVLKSCEKWQLLLEGCEVSTIDLAGMDHTFSSKKWRDEVSQITLKWVKEQSLK